MRDGNEEFLELGLFGAAAGLAQLGRQTDGLHFFLQRLPAGIDASSLS